MSAPLRLAASLAFVVAVFLAVYPFAVYPLLLLFVPRRRRSSPAAASIPRATVIVSVHNGEKVITRKIENAVTLGYPQDLLEILVVSDGSTDGTDALVRAVRDTRVRLISYANRRGKTAGLTDAVPRATGEILLFTDANAWLEPDALERVGRWFADESVGFVTGRTIYTDTLKGDSLDLYSRLEGWIKGRQSRTGHCVGADGAIFAIRKNLFPPLREDDINDLAIPLAVIAKGFRGICDEAIVCREQAPPAGTRAFRRQVRISTRSIRAVSRRLSLANPLASGWFSFHFVSHKILRFAVPWAMLVALAANVALSQSSSLFRGVLAIHLLIYAGAAVGLLIPPGGLLLAPLRMLAGFVAVQAAVLVAWVRLLAGARDSIWEPSH